jgi:hypothetical protein
MVQFLIIMSLLNKHYGAHHTSQSSIASIPKSQSVPLCIPVPGSSTDAAVSTAKSGAKLSTNGESYGGVAATLLLHAPTWFQRRYTMMIQNAVSNIPEDWVVQIFYTPSGQSKHGLDINPGIQRFVLSGKVLLTAIPDSVLRVKKKRFELMFEPWIWNSMLADKILIFGGNAVICSNSPYAVADFSHFDYIGSPWDFKKGVGGDGGISIRSRRAMLAAIEFALQDVDENKRETAFRGWGQEDQFYVRTLLHMNSRAAAGSTPRWKLATRNDTLTFSAIGGVVNNDVLVVSGTLSAVPYDDRQAFLNVCPEIKMFYPSLHDPHCFGAEPDGEQCAKTICALKSKKERRGGC